MTVCMSIWSRRYGHSRCASGKPSTNIRLDLNPLRTPGGRLQKQRHSWVIGAVSTPGEN